LVKSGWVFEFRGNHFNRENKLIGFSDDGKPEKQPKPKKEKTLISKPSFTPFQILLNKVFI